MKKFFTKTLLPLLIAVLVIVPTANAADKFIFQQFFKAGSNTMGAFFVPSESGVLQSEVSTTFSMSDFSSEESLRSATATAIADWANNNGYVGKTANDVYFYTPGLAAIARSGLFSDISSKPTTLAGYGISDAVPNTRTINGQALSSNVTITKSDISLGNVDNTSDANKPVSTATQTALNLKADATSVAKCYEGITLRVPCLSIAKNATVASGVAVFHLTDDGTSGGAALFPNGIIQDSIDVEVNDAAASYQMSYALSNGNKTVTVTANKLTTANILSGILGQAQANGSVVRLVVRGY